MSTDFSTIKINQLLSKADNYKNKAISLEGEEVSIYENKFINMFSGKLNSELQFDEKTCKWVVTLNRDPELLSHIYVASDTLLRTGFSFTFYLSRKTIVASNNQIDLDIPNIFKGLTTNKNAKVYPSNHVYQDEYIIDGIWNSNIFTPTDAQDIVNGEMYTVVGDLKFLISFPGRTDPQISMDFDIPNEMEYFTVSHITNHITTTITSSNDSQSEDLFITDDTFNEIKNHKLTDSFMMKTSQDASIIKIILYDENKRYLSTITKNNIKANFIYKINNICEDARYFKIATNCNFTGNIVVTTPDILNKLEIYTLTSDVVYLKRLKMFVGKDKEFKTIGSAITELSKYNFPPANIFISNGIYKYSEDDYPSNFQEGYKAVIYTPPLSNINFFGESREGVIIHSTQGLYNYAPVLVKHGNVSLQNMTVIADHTENTEFAYIGEPHTYTWERIENRNAYYDISFIYNSGNYTIDVNKSDSSGRTIFMYFNKKINFNSPANNDSDETVKDIELTLYNSAGQQIGDSIDLLTSLKNDSGTYIIEAPSYHHFTLTISDRFNEHLENNNTKLFFSGIGSHVMAYAIHIDGGKKIETGSKVYIKNVTAISYQSQAFGLGTIPYSTIRIEDCDAISYLEKISNKIHSAGGVGMTYGSIIIHTASLQEYPAIHDGTGSEEYFELINTNIHSENSKTGIYVMGSGEDPEVPNRDERLLHLTAINTTLTTNAKNEDDNEDIENHEALYEVHKANSRSEIQKISCGNTNNDLNYQNE